MVEQAQAQGISQRRLEEVIIHFVQIYLQESQEEALLSTEPVWIDGTEFAHRIITNNRKLFEELARL